MDPDTKYTTARGAVQDLDVSQQQQIIADSVDELPDNVKVAAVRKATEALSDQQKQSVAVSTVQTLSPDQQQAVASILQQPTTRANDTIWLIIISSFCAILVGIVAVMAVGWMRERPFEPNFLTIFTTVSAFLIGLFAQGPNKNS